MDLKKLVRAKKYIDSLSEGINPLNGELLSDDDVVRQVQFIRCFQFISTVLSDVIENGGVQVDPSDRDPFSPKDIDFSGFQYSKKPILISDFTKRINSCIPKTMQKMSFITLLRWMEKNEYLDKLVETEVKETKHYIAGKRASEIGITEEERKTKRGLYTVVVYSKEAQEFLIKSLPYIAQEESLSKNQGKKWEPQEDETILSMWREGTEIAQMSKQLQRTPVAIRMRLEKLFSEKAKD